MRRCQVLGLWPAAFPGILAGSQTGIILSMQSALICYDSTTMLTTILIHWKIDNMMCFFFLWNHYNIFSGRKSELDTLNCCVWKHVYLNVGLRLLSKKTWCLIHKSVICSSFHTILFKDIIPVTFFFFSAFYCETSQITGYNLYLQKRGKHK